MLSFLFFLFACYEFLWSCGAAAPYPGNSSDISISFTSTTDAKYIKKFPGEFPPQSTAFKDTTIESTTLDSLYYFVSNAGDFTDRSEWPVLMMSTIYDSNANVFSNDENVISSQIPYHVYAANQSFLGGGAIGYQLLSCTNGNTYDIIICYNIAENLSPMVYCLIFFNDYLTPKWSNPIPIINQTIPIDPLSFTLECLHDGYLILFQALTFYEKEKPNTLYTLLDIDGNIVMYVSILFLPFFFCIFFFFVVRFVFAVHNCEKVFVKQSQTQNKTKNGTNTLYYINVYITHRNSRELFDENVFNFTIIVPRVVIASHQNNANSMSINNSDNNKDTQILVSVCMGHPRSMGAFYLHYTNKSDANPLHVNYATSGNEFVAITNGGSISLSLKYYEMDSTTNCCYMTSYFVSHYKSDPREFYEDLYLAIIDGNGNKLFNDTLIETIDHTLGYKNTTMSSEIHQLNINGSGTDGHGNMYYFGVFITTEENILVRTFYIDMHEKILTPMQTIRLINIEDLPNVDNVYDNFVDIYVDSQLKYSNSEIFFVYQAYASEYAQNSTSSLSMFVQAYNYSVN